MNFKKVFCILFLLCIILLPLSVSADMGPKPKLTVIVSNPPEDEYYLDLLIDYDLPQCDNLEGIRDTFDPVKLELLEEYYKNGWCTALAHGTRKPLWGELTGEEHDGCLVHSFAYVGVPDRYKIIIVTPENEILISRIIEKKSYSSTVYYDYATREVTEQDGLTLAWTYAKQFLMTLLPTLILEGIILLLFRFKTAHTLRLFFVVNVLTQAGMTLVMSTSLLTFGIYSSYVVLLPVELVITVVEVVAYTFLLKEGRKRKRLAYAVTANIVSSLAMPPLLYLEYQLFIN